MRSKYSYAEAMSLHLPSASVKNKAPPRRTDHTYRDFSKFALDKLPLNMKLQTNFPSKLHQILSTPEYSQVSHVGGVLSTVALDFRISEELFTVFLLPPFRLINLALSSDHFLDGKNISRSFQWGNVMFIVPLYSVPF